MNENLELVPKQEDNYFAVSDRDSFVQKLKDGIKSSGGATPNSKGLLYFFSYKNTIGSIGNLAGVDIWTRFVREMNSFNDTKQTSYLKTLLSKAISELVSENFLFKISYSDIDKLGLKSGEYYSSYSYYTNADGKKILEDAD